MHRQVSTYLGMQDRLLVQVAMVQIRCNLHSQFSALVAHAPSVKSTIPGPASGCRLFRTADIWLQRQKDKALTASRMAG